MSNRKVYCPILSINGNMYHECLYEDCAIFNRKVHMCGFAYIPPIEQKRIREVFGDK
jgi:hypothetical protein